MTYIFFLLIINSNFFFYFLLINNIINISVNTLLYNVMIGGPLLEMKTGNVIGMNTALISTSGAFAGIGLAIPIDTIKVIVQILIRDGGKLITTNSGIDYITGFQAKLLGVNQGLIVLKVQKNSPADYAGIRGISTSGNFLFAVDRPIIGDIILKVNGILVNSEADFLNNIDQAKVKGDTVELTVLRNLERSSTTTSTSGASSGTSSSVNMIPKQNSNFKEILLKLKF